MRTKGFARDSRLIFVITCTMAELQISEVQYQQMQAQQVGGEAAYTGAEESMDTSQSQFVPQQQSQPQFMADQPGNGAPQSQAVCEEHTHVSVQQGEGEIPSDDRKIFVGGLSRDTTDASLKEYFNQYGEVVDAKVKMDPLTHQSRGFAFVVFQEAEALDEVLGTPQEPKVHVIDDKKVDAKRAIPHANHQAMKNRTKKIFVGGVPSDMEADVLKNYFKSYGEIEEVAIVTEKGSSKRRGFCFVTFTSEDCVDKCTEQTFHQVENTQVEVKRATPRDQNTPRGGMRGRGGGRGGHFGGKGAWMPYGQYGGYSGYGGGGYGGFDPNYGPAGFQEGFYGGAGGGYGGYGPRGGGGGGPGSRYGPMKGNYTHDHGAGSPYHPYSR